MKPLSRNPLVLLVVVLLAGTGPTAAARAASAAPPNVLLIVCDDLNDWVGPLGGHPQTITPAIDAFARTGVTFEHAYTNTPVCAPSRASFLTGIYPHTSRNLFWDPWHRNEVLANSSTLMRFFRDNGYLAVGAGKLMHHQRAQEWDELASTADYGPLAFDGTRRVAHPAVQEPFWSIGPIDGSFARLDDVPYAGSGVEGAGWVYGRREGGRDVPMRFVSPDDRDPTPDEAVATWAVERLAALASDDDDRPFFMGVGFIRPHTPMHAPGRFFDMHPLESVELPTILLDDEHDTHYREVYEPSVKGLRYHTTIEAAYGSREEGIRRFTQAYLACVSFVDEQIGRVLAGLDVAGLADDTIVIITSDHGFNVGEKRFLFKNSPWEESNRIPMFIRAPGVTRAGGVAGRPVSLIDIYPTLVDLCGLSGDTRRNDRGRPLDGHSLRSLLEEPAAGRWTGPEGALSMLHAREDASVAFDPTDEDNPLRQHWSLRTEHWRYVRYADGAEELYDHRADPYEWDNLATDAGSAEVRARLGRLLDDMLAGASAD